MGQRIELYKQFNQKQENYTYYIIAFSVAAIGYAIHQTGGVPYKYSQIPLGIAVLSWGLSVFLGLRFIRLVISTVYTNMGLMDIKEGKDPLSGNHPQKIAIGYETVKGIIDTNSKTASNLHKWQYRFFFFGMISLIAWHLYEMYLISV